MISPKTFASFEGLKVYFIKNIWGWIPWMDLGIAILSEGSHPTISSSVVPFSFHLQSFPASGSFQMSQFFTSGGQSIGVSASASVLPINTQDWSPLGWTGWISLQSTGLSRVFSTPQFKGTSSSVLSLLYGPTPYIHTWLLEKPQLWLYRPM